LVPHLFCVERKKVTKNLGELLEQWNEFTTNREDARHRLQNPEGVEELRLELTEKLQQLQQVKAEVELIKAKITLARGSTTYVKNAFDHTWATKKATLKADLEEALLAEMETKSIPKIMTEYGIMNTTMLYRLKQRKEHLRSEAATQADSREWEWSDFTGTHRYALAKDDSGEYAYVKLAGTLDTDLEGEYAIYDRRTGEFLTGNIEVFQSDTEAGRNKRVEQLESILEHRYTGVWKQAPNPYYS
jgi:hypothetical protein